MPQQSKSKRRPPPTSGPARGRTSRRPSRAPAGADPTGAVLRLAVAGSNRPGLGWYLELSQRPLQILVFLLPLIALYEIGTWLYASGAAIGASGDEAITISAYKLLNDFFGAFGVGGLYLPGLAIITVLLVWHVLARDPWEVHLGVPVVMLVESFLLAIPLLVLDQLIHRLFAGGAGPALALLAGPAVESLPWQARLTLSIGAGIYEELVFRMIIIALVHMVLVDFGKMKSGPGAIIALLVSAVAFTFYHDVKIEGVIQPDLVAFFLLSGLFFASVYVVRGFGAAVGAHAMYDVLVIVIHPLLAGGRA